MSSFVKISDAASLALHTAILLATEPGKVFSTRQISEILQASENHLHKVLQRLNRQGIVKPVRGPKGGYKLVKDGNDINLLEIFQVMEGPVQPRQCLFDQPVCCQSKCLLGGLISKVDRDIAEKMKHTYLSGLTHLFKCKVRSEYSGQTTDHKN